MHFVEQIQKAAKGSSTIQVIRDNIHDGVRARGGGGGDKKKDFTEETEVTIRMHWYS